MIEPSANLSRAMYLADRAVAHAIPALREQLKLKANEFPPAELVAAYILVAAIADLADTIEAAGIAQADAR
jgi:hypothetical protein